MTSNPTFWAVIEGQDLNATYKLVVLKTIVDIASSVHEPTYSKNRRFVFLPRDLLLDGLVRFYCGIYFRDANCHQTSVVKAGKRETAIFSIFRKFRDASGLNDLESALPMLLASHRATLNPKIEKAADQARRKIWSLIVKKQVEKFLVYPGRQVPVIQTTDDHLKIRANLWEEVAISPQPHASALQWMLAVKLSNLGNENSFELVKMVMAKASKIEDDRFKKLLKGVVHQLPCIWTSKKSEHVDHCIPKSKGGGGILYNMFPSKAAENITKRARVPTEKRLLLAREKIMATWKKYAETANLAEPFAAQVRMDFGIEVRIKGWLVKLWAKFLNRIREITRLGLVEAW